MSILLLTYYAMGERPEFPLTTLYSPVVGPCGRRILGFRVFLFRDQIRHARSLAGDNKSIIGTVRVGLISLRTGRGFNIDWGVAQRNILARVGGCSAIFKGNG